MEEQQRRGHERLEKLQKERKVPPDKVILDGYKKYKHKEGEFKVVFKVHSTLPRECYIASHRM